MHKIKFTGNTVNKKSLTTILSADVPFQKVFGEPFDNVYCTKEAMEVIFVEPSGGIEEEYICRVAPSSKPLPGRSKVQGNVQSISVQASSPEGKLIAEMFQV